MFRVGWSLVIDGITMGREWRLANRIAGMAAGTILGAAGGTMLGIPGVGASVGASIGDELGGYLYDLFDPNRKKWEDAENAEEAPPRHYDPLVLDLNRDGKINLDNATFFDLNASGFHEYTRWIPRPTRSSFWTSTETAKSPQRRVRSH